MCLGAEVIRSRRGHEISGKIINISELLQTDALGQVSNVGNNITMTAYKMQKLCIVHVQ